jgi:ubiquinone/menaquinone biosynthesis C-methylase UbiE
LHVGDDMSLQSNVKGSYLDLLFEAFQLRVLHRAHGNYTKSYESFKRIENTESFFRQALDGRDRVAVLDVGCGDGYHVFVFNSRDDVRERVTFQGIDSSELKIEFARRVAAALEMENVDFRVGDAEDPEFPDESIDIVLCSDVVEHLEHPEICFAGIRRVLKAGGAVIVTTPNASNPIIRFANVLRSAGLFRNPKDPERGGQGEHISLKGLKEWVQIAKDSGLEVLAVRRGALVFGGDAFNRFPVLFALALLADRLIDILPFCRNWGEAITLYLKKP